MELIRPDDPQYFEQSSYEDYDRHHYKVVGKNGESIVVEDYMFGTRNLVESKSIPLTY